jgi:hypothetical protein
MSWRRLLSCWGVGLAALAIALALTARSHAYFLWPDALPLNIDEGYITAMALRMVRGHWLPYVDGVSQRGPITYWLATTVMSLGGMFSWGALRVLAMGLAFSTLLLLFLLSRELFSPFAAGIAVLVQTYFVTYELSPWDGMGYNGEVVAVQFVLLSALFLARAQLRAPPPPGVAGRRPWKRPLVLFAAGAFAACAGLSKQVTLTHVGPALLWILLGPRRAIDAVGPKGSDRLFGPAVRRDLGWYGFGFVLPFAVVVGIYRLAGHLSEFVYYFQKYGRDIFMAPLTPEVMSKKLEETIDNNLFGIAAVSAVALLALARAIQTFFTTAVDPSAGGDAVGLRGPRRGGDLRWARNLARLRAQAPSAFAILQFLAALEGACFSWRFFGHYFVQFYPFAGLLAGYAVAGHFEDMDEDHLPSVLAGAVMVGGAALLLLVADSSLHRRNVARSITERFYQRPKDNPIVRYVMQRSAPTDSIFVWGFRAEVYVSAERYPASRYVYTVYPSGVVPWYDATPAEEKSRVVPGSQEQLLLELESSKPELLIDAGRSMRGRYMYEIPAFRRYIDKEYCFARFVEGEPIYRRRHGSSCLPPDYY